MAGVRDLRLRLAGNLTSIGPSLGVGISLGVGLAALPSSTRAKLGIGIALGIGSTRAKLCIGVGISLGSGPCRQRPATELSKTSLKRLCCISCRLTSSCSGLMSVEGISSGSPRQPAKLCALAVGGGPSLSRWSTEMLWSAHDRGLSKVISHTRQRHHGRIGSFGVRSFGAQRQ